MDNYWIVVVDDDVTSLKLIRSTLKDQMMKVSVLRSGRELLTFVQKHSPDLILLDVLMPEMDGFETYRQLRDIEKKDGTNPTPVIFLTGEADADVEKRGLKEGAADFLHKPANKEVLLQRIHNTINNSRVMENLMTEANTDRLTGLLNKIGGEQRMTEMCRTLTGALLMIDLDSFKLVNDLYGHDCGDRVLAGFADILRKNSRSSDELSRIGGDEFMGFYVGMVEEDAMISLQERINADLSALAVMLMGEEHGIPLGASVGAVFVPSHGTEFQQLYKRSDLALYNVKQNGKHGSAVYDPRMSVTGSTGDPEAELNRMIQLMEERGRTNAPMFVSRDDMTAIMRHVRRASDANDMESALVRCELDKIGPIEADPDLLEKAEDMFRDILEDRLRSTDVVYVRSNLYYVLMPDVSVIESDRIIDDISFLWKQNMYSSWFEIDHVTRSLS
ncbi:MAG: diguanylate cyclase [Lachnospiraceae bacterium]|nr:diguanylate cyclase [Lachnospiraceae bacterium]